MVDRSLIVSLEDKGSIQRAQALVDEFVDRPSDLRIESLKRRKWAAMPVADSINYMEAEWIAEAAVDLETAECFAITTELPDSTTETSCYLVPMTQEGVIAFDFVLAPFNALLAPFDGSFAIVRESSYYYLVAGPEPFVRKAVGCSFKTARTMFTDYAQGFDQEREWLLSIASKYDSIDGK